MPSYPVSLRAAEAAPRVKPSNYPAPFAVLMANRVKRPLGDLFGLANFGVNLTTLNPGGKSALLHAHSKQDEFVYILQGSPTLLNGAGRTPLSPGDCTGFKAGTGDGHCLINETEADVVYLEVGDRSSGDEVVYAEDDLQAVMVDGKWVYAHKDGTPY